LGFFLGYGGAARAEVEAEGAGESVPGCCGVSRLSPMVLSRSILWIGMGDFGKRSDGLAVVLNICSMEIL
jgi:hypothetical protein